MRIYVANKTTTEAPSGSAADWDLLASGGSGGGGGAIAYGELRISTAQMYPDITQTWSPINVWNQLTITPVGCTMNTAGVYTFGAAGIWDLLLQMDFSHAGTGGFKNLYLRLYNITTGTPSGEVKITVSQDLISTHFNVSFWREITAAEVGNQFRVEWRSDIANFTNVGVQMAVVRLEQKTAA